jgi:hypothetical protein
MTRGLPVNLRIGTSSWSSSDWCGNFYPESIAAGEMIWAYSSRFSTVEIDSTWHHMPGRKMVDAWSSRTPGGLNHFNNHYAGYAPGSVELFESSISKVLFLLCHLNEEGVAPAECPISTD